MSVADLLTRTRRFDQSLLTNAAHNASCCLVTMSSALWACLPTGGPTSSEELVCITTAAQVVIVLGVCVSTDRSQHYPTLFRHPPLTTLSLTHTHLHMHPVFPCLAVHLSSLWPLLHWHITLVGLCTAWKAVLGAAGSAITSLPLTTAHTHSLTTVCHRTAGVAVCGSLCILLRNSSSGENTTTPCSLHHPARPVLRALL